MDLTNTTLSFLTTTPFMTTGVTTEVPFVRYPAYLGYIAILVAVLLFGSNFVPVKKFETGDGMFFQLISCIVIWCSGLVVNAARGFPQFYPLAMLGGFLWTTGNIMTVPIIKTVGLGQGLCIWASFNLLAGWASGRFGWFGLNPELPNHEVLNYLGVACCTISAFVYMFLKTDIQPVSESYSDIGISDTASETSGDEHTSSDEREPMLGNSERGLMNDSVRSIVIIPTQQGSFFDRLPKFTKRIVGTGMAIIAGILFGLNFVPVIYIQDNYPGKQHSRGLDYVFAHFSGILISSVFYFTIYCIIMKNKPLVYPQAILPSMVSGVMWAIADVGWFIANDTLSSAISFPIITSVPAMIAACWGIMFKEIRGKKNLLILLLAVLFAVSGSVLTGISKMGDSSNNSTMIY